MTRGLAADVAHFHAPTPTAGVGRQVRAEFGVPIGAAGPDVRYGAGQVVVAGLPAHQAAQVIPLVGKQAQVELAFSGESGAVASTAESLRYAAYYTDFSPCRVVCA